MTEVAKQESRGIVASDAAAWASSQNVEASDFLIPRLLIQQGQSEFVMEGKAKIGDICKSTTKAVLGDRSKPIEIIPLTFDKSWRIEEKVENKYKYRRGEPYTSATMNLPLEFQEGGSEWRRVLCYNLYVLLREEITNEMELLKTGGLPDPDKILLPCYFQLRLTMVKYAKTLSTWFGAAKQYRVSPASYVWKVQTQIDKNEKGQWAVPVITKGATTTPEEMALCLRWYNAISASSLKVDEDPDAVEVATEAPDVNAPGQQF
jgi:hypothetical protein